jgi:thioredoxin reductase/ferredoxin
LGVEIVTNHPVDGASGIHDLLSQGFDAVLIATGASGRWTGFDGTGWIPGSGLRGIQGASEFTISHRKCRPEDIHENTCKVAILGYGVQALACARASARLGGKEISWIIPFEKSELQPDPRLIKQAEEEGVIIVEKTKPIEIIGIDNKVVGVKCVEIELSEPDHTGRRTWVSKTGTEIVIACESVIDASYSMPDTEWHSLSSGPFHTIPVNLDTMATSRPGIFAAGDVASGSKSIVEAVSLGHRAAAGITNYLNGETEKIGTLSTPIRISGWQVDDPARTPSKVLRPTVRPTEDRIKDNDEAELGFTLWEAEHEAGRCLLCGPCEECAVCISQCTRKKIATEDESGNTLVVRVPLEMARTLYRDVEAAASKGIDILAAKVDPERCRACGVCEQICGYHAPSLSLQPNGKYASSVDILACKGCGTCIAACPSGAIDQGLTSLHAIRNLIWGASK